MKFLAIGECMAEIAPSNIADNFQLGFAGDTFNTAWYLARLQPDCAVSYLTAVGDDAISQQMRDLFVASNINDKHVQTIVGRTVGVYMISLDNGERSFSYWRGQSAAKQLADNVDALAAAMADVDVIYFSGITLAILDAPARANLFKALGDARQASKVVAFDPNLRSRLWANTIEMTEVIMQGAAVSDIALPSYEDEESWFADANPKATIERYKSAGVTTIIVKNGADSVHYYQANSEGMVSVPALSSVVDTTAAGDSFNAGIFAGIANALSLEKSIDIACQLAGKVVLGKGALVPIDLNA